MRALGETVVTWFAALAAGVALVIVFLGVIVAKMWPLLLALAALKWLAS